MPVRIFPGRRFFRTNSREPLPGRRHPDPWGPRSGRPDHWTQPATKGDIHKWRHTNFKKQNFKLLNSSFHKLGPNWEHLFIFWLNMFYFFVSFFPLLGSPCLWTSSLRPTQKGCLSSLGGYGAEPLYYMKWSRLAAILICRFSNGLDQFILGNGHPSLQGLTKQKQDQSIK